MLFRRLLQSNSRTGWLTTAEGYVVSVIAHVVLVGGTVIATADQMGHRELAPSFTPVEYFIPRDRSIGTPPVPERVTYISTTPVPGGEGMLPKATKDPFALQVVRQEGTADKELAGATAPPPPEPNYGDSVMTVLEVDTAAARYEDSEAPPYPPTMLDRRIEGVVAVQYVVDTSGHADTSSVIVLSATHPDFAASVKHTLPNMHFRPAIMNTQKVRQLVQQLFSFKIDTTMLVQHVKRK